MRRILSSLALAAALTAADPATPIASLRIADGTKLAADWAASIYAKVWADPGLKPIRDRQAELLAKATAEIGFNPLEALLAMKGAQVTFIGMKSEREPQILIRADLGAFASKVMAQIADKSGSSVPRKVAGADEAIGDAKGVVTVARFGTVISCGFFTAPVAKAPTGDAAADLAVDADLKRIMKVIAAAMPQSDRAAFELAMADSDKHLGQMTYRSDIVPEGIRDRVTVNVFSPVPKAVDRAVLARLPATTLMTLAMGFEGKGMWKAAGNSWLAQIDSAMHRGQPVGNVQTAEEIKMMLQTMGITGGLQELVESLNGTVIFALTQGAPFPAATIALPRAQLIDQLIAAGLGKIGAEMPAEGQSSMLPLPGRVPVALSLLRDKTHWVLSTDAMLLASWPSGAPGGFADTVMAKTLYAKAPVGAYLQGASDTPTVLRTIQGYLGMVLGMSNGLTPEQKQGINTAMNRLAATASTGYIYGTYDSTGGVTEMRGLLGGAFVPAMIAAIAIPNLMESRVVSYEAAAASTLKSGVFAAQVQFQFGSYQDGDSDNVGEYGLISELSGRRATNKIGAGAIKLLQGPLATGDTANGYRFASYLPDGKGGAIGEPQGDGAAARPAVADAANDQEKYFLVYAWPISGDSGRRIFVMSEDGQLRSQFWDGKDPQWNDVFGGGTWTDEKTWPLHPGHRLAPAIRVQPIPEPMPPVPTNERPLF